MNFPTDMGSRSDREIHSPGRDPFAHSEKLHQARYAVYKMLSLAYLYPGDIEWDEFVRELPGILAEAADILELDLTAEMETLSGLSEILDFEQICCEHTMLFINNPHDDPVSPYESVYLEDTIMGRCARVVQEFYEQHGLAVDRQHSYLLPDHIALELDFMAWLIEKGMESGSSSLGEQLRFFSDHPGLWARRFLADVRTVTTNSYFFSLATVADKFLQNEKQLFFFWNQKK
ncbi:TorD/DmsD family molecular chaperone [Desulfolithobacter dissulfuricans]|nr:molecular chaperone TorD family protein [Desulfolithobacter dissulfuricans]